ncbi:MAG: hypothetical protein DLM69_02280 [Candidatus Chloroheliales bacterium]|nr:MAG: hypothetical protein DLM69_02280 [Chloroflexota bacterium]
MATQTYTFTAVVNWQGDHYDAFGVEFPIGGKGATISEVIEALREEAKEFLAEGEQPNYVEPIVEPFEISVQDSDGTMRNYRFDAVLYEEDGGYCSFCPEVGTASCGDDFDDAMYMIKDATELTLQDSPPPNYGKPEIIKYQLTFSPAGLVNA